MKREPIKTVNIEPLLPTPTIRDDFAMAALIGILSNPEGYCNPKQAVREAWTYADAMLEARDKAKEDA